MAPSLDRAFMFEQPALDAELEAFGARAHEATDGLAGPDHAVARHDHGNGIGAAGTADRARRGAQLARELAVGARLPGRDALHRFPDLQAVMRARKRERQV